MFRLQPNPTFRAKVPLGIAGQAKPVEIEIEFKYLSRSQLKDFFARAEGREDQEALAEIVVGWSGVDAPYSPEALATLLDNYPTAALDIFEAFRRELLEAKRKN